MAITVDELIAVRREVGDKPDDATVGDVFDRLGGNVEATIDEILETRLATLMASPAQFSIPGEYSQSTAANITALQTKLNARGVGDTGSLSFIPAPTPPAR